uniref:Uncharacterized protein n=1 Tax=Rhabditophanes sp. KR3021 TaxID=114890 RepID=A0AC35TZW4_9BILA
MVSDKKSDSKDTNVNLFLTEINFTISRIEQIMLGDDHLRPVSRDLRNSHEAFHSAIRNEESYSGYDSSLGEYESDSSDESCLVTEMNISDIESLDENYFESQNAVNDAEELIEADVGESHVNASQTFTLAGNSDVNSASDIKRSILAGKCDVAEFFKVLNNAGDNNVKNSFTKDNSKYWAQFFRKMNDDPEARLEQLAYLEPHHYKEVDEKFPGLLNNFKTFLIRLVEIQKKNALIKANASEGEQTLFKSIVSEENLLAKITPDMETKLAFAKVDPFFRRCINKSPVEILNRFVYNNTDINLNFNQKGLVGTIFGFPFKFIEDAFEIVDVFERDNLSSIRYIEVRIEINNKGIHIRDKVRVLSDLMRNLFAKLNNIAHLVFYIKELEKQYLDRTPNHAILFGLLAGFKSTRITTFTYEGFESRVHWQNQSGGLRCINLKAPTDMELFLKLEKFGMRYN